MPFRSHVKRAPVHLRTFTSSEEHGNTARRMVEYYNFPPVPTKAPTIAIISLGGSYKMADLQAYWQLQGIPGTPNIRHVNVAGSRTLPDQEAVAEDGSDENTLDLEIATSICPAAPIIVYSGPNSYDGFFRTIQEAIRGPAKIISISWGAPENMFNGLVGVNAFERLFHQAQNAGKVIVVAAGDAGSSDGTRQLITDFPSSSPSVVSCGGTSLLPTGEEIGWAWNPKEQWGTGGGVSTYFPAPSYQRGTIGPYSGRATPDIALLADPSDGWSIYFQGKLHVNSWGGTSAVAPAIAGLLACYNLTSYSSLHQQLYNVSQTIVFRDILTGNNDSLTPDKQSYSAKKGYDLVTGLGSVHGLHLRSVLAPSAK